MTQICICVVTVVAIASAALVLFSVAECQRQTNIERAKAGYIYHGVDAMEPSKK